MAASGRRSSSAALISPSVSFQERLFPRMASFGEDLDKAKKRSLTNNNNTEDVEIEKLPKPKSNAKVSGVEGPKKQQQQKGDNKKQQQAKPKVSPAPKNEYRIPTNKSKQKQILKEKVNLDSKIVPLFSHLAQYNSTTMSSSIQEKIGKRNIHPAVIALGMQYSERVISGGNARCMAMLIAFQRVFY